MNNPLYQKHIISIPDFSRQELELIVDTAQSIKQQPRPELLKNKVVASCFFEASTRTRLSFETAVQRLGGSVIGFADGANKRAWVDQFHAFRGLLLARGVSGNRTDGTASERARNAVLCITCRQNDQSTARNRTQRRAVHCRFANDIARHVGERGCLLCHLDFARTGGRCNWPAACAEHWLIRFHAASQAKGDCGTKNET